MRPHWYQQPGAKWFVPPPPECRVDEAEPANPQPATRRGRRDAAYWGVEHEFIDAFLVENGCAAPGDGQQAQIERIVAERLADTLDEPPDRGQSGDT